MNGPKTNPASPRTMVVIPHYGSDAMLQQCLDGVHRNPGLTDEDVIVIDNNENNRMFTAAVNEGIVVARQRGADYVWILNNDTIPEPDYLAHSLARFTLSPRCALVGGKNLRMDDPDRIFWGGSGRSFPSGRCKMGRVSAGDLTAATEENWGPFSSVILDTNLIDLVGLLDEQFLMICSDSDYCFRLRLAGYQVWYEPRSVILHKLGVSSKSRRQQDPGFLRILRTDQQRFMRKWSRVTGCNDAEKLDQAINDYIAGRLAPDQIKYSD